MQHVRIPSDRVAVLIGPGGKTKEKIQSKTGCTVNVSEGEVSLEGDPLDEWIAKDVVQAVGRGFTPEKALTLTQEDNRLEFLDIKEYATTPNSKTRLKGRIIGEKGRTRRFIERSAGVLVSVYGDTVGFIGPYDRILLAKQAASMILEGSRHGTVYRYLEKQARPPR